ncbi:thermonuclease family protein [Rhizobium straminoryzae]|uniref:Thermonuclease family protein n=1 Tax=Rhizobium straminoryzae TaxID=1387186 RepID=A0A549T4X4_9HYPH|nr:thermonuclease family protein [Rhizobium straminoryzae]TRL36870.1 thermonuclease family protein [Rhizobium straminoryzae]
MSRRFHDVPGRRLVRDLALTAAFLLLLALLAARWGNEGTDQVFNGPFAVLDGDTLAEHGQRLRLTGIDAPEIDQTCARADGTAWPCGRVARARLSALIAQAEPQCRGAAVDRYGRPLVTCEADGEDLNGRLVREGLALASGSVRYRAEQAAAETARRGLWSGSFETPRDFRRRAGLGDDEAAEARRLWQWLAERFAWIWG